MKEADLKTLWKQRIAGFAIVAERTRQERREASPDELLEQAEAMFDPQPEDEAARVEQEKVWKVWQRIRQQWVRQVASEALEKRAGGQP